MKLNYFILLILLPAVGLCQKQDSLVQKLDSLNRKTDSVGSQKNNIRPGNYTDRSKITPSTYLTLLASDFKQQATAPFHIGGKGWARVGAFTAVTGALMLADEPVQQFASKMRNNNKTVANVSKVITNTGGVYESITLAALGTYGFIAKDEKVKTTTLLASQAYITSATFSYVLKTLAGRQRPSYYRQDRVEAEPTFRGPFANAGRDQDGKKLNASFPSGHTTVAFSAATVYAMEYRDKPIIPIISYTAASLIGISRITENRHWFTDVLVGAALGHLCGRQVVNNYHRFAKVQQTAHRQSGQISLSLNYNDHLIAPVITYRPVAKNSHQSDTW